MLVKLSTDKTPDSSKYLPQSCLVASGGMDRDSQRW